MTLAVSDQSQRISGRLYAFGILASATKILDLKSITIANAEAPIEEPSKLIGLLAFLTLSMTLALAPCLARDFLSQRIDDALDEPSPEFFPPDESKMNSSRVRAAEDTALYMALDGLSTALEAVIPIIFGAIVTVYCFNEMVKTIQSILT